MDSCQIFSVDIIRHKIYNIIEIKWDIIRLE